MIESAEKNIQVNDDACSKVFRLKHAWIQRFNGFSH